MFLKGEFNIKDSWGENENNNDLANQKKPPVKDPK